MTEFPMLSIESCSGVYIIYNFASNHFYIGSSFDVSKRIPVHYKGKGNVAVANAIRKYGVENIKAFLLEKADRKELSKREGYWIQKLKPKYNLTIITETGGRIARPESIAKTLAAKTGYKHSEETKRKIGDSNRGKRRSKEQQDRLSEALRNSPKARANIERMIDYWRGRPRSEEFKAKMSAKGKGREVSEETKQKLRIANLGKRMSDEARAKMSASAKMRRASDETKMKMSRAATGRKHTEEAIALMKVKKQLHWDSKGNKHKQQSIEKMKVKHKENRQLFLLLLKLTSEAYA